jgi:hypothetical protein
MAGWGEVPEAVEVVDVGRFDAEASVLTGGEMFGMTFGSRMATCAPFKSVESTFREFAVRGGSSGFSYLHRLMSDNRWCAGMTPASVSPAWRVAIAGNGEVSRMTANGRDRP